MPSVSSQLAAFGGVAIAMGLGSYLAGSAYGSPREKVDEDEFMRGAVCKPDYIVSGSPIRFSRIASLDYLCQQLSHYRNRPAQDRNSVLDDRA